MPVHLAPLHESPQRPRLLDEPRNERSRDLEVIGALAMSVREPRSTGHPRTSPTARALISATPQRRLTRPAEVALECEPGLAAEALEHDQLHVDLAAIAYATSAVVAAQGDELLARSRF